MVRKLLKGVRSPVSIKKKKEEKKMQVNEMATPTRKSGKENMVSLAVQGNTMGGYNLQCTVIRTDTNR